MQRRTFLIAGGSMLSAQTMPSDRIVLGVIGAGGRGNLVTATFQKDPSIHVGGICDVDEPNLERALSRAAKA